jgi:hypothetical protein
MASRIRGNAFWGNSRDPIEALIVVSGARDHSRRTAKRHPLQPRKPCRDRRTASPEAPGHIGAPNAMKERLPDSGFSLSVESYLQA